MTAGGGWVSLNGSLCEALTLLHVGYDAVVLQIERCTGACCGKIALGVGWGLEGGLNPEELRVMGRASAELRVWLDRNGVHRMPVRDGAIIAELFESIGEGDAPNGERMNHFRCRQHCRATGDCGIYDRRPSMCSTHGMRGVCDVRGCTMRVQVNPLVVHDRGGG